MPTAGRGSDEGYTRLRAAILSGRFLPNERLIELELAQTLEVGRAAVRTALARLEQDGIVEREPFRGARVRAIAEEEAIEILEARSVLEGLAVRYAASHASDDDSAALRAFVERMQEAHAGGDLPGISEINGQLHRYLLQVAQHHTATRLIDGLQAQNVRFQYRTILVPGRAAQSLREHRALVEAVARHDAEAAEAAMRYHLAQVTEALRQTRALPTALADLRGV